MAGRVVFFMSGERSSNTVAVVIELDRDEMARRGKLGAAALHARYDAVELARKGRQTFLSRLSDEERREHFSALGRKSAEARRAHTAALAEGGTA
jgi:hypothetical protein